MFELNSLFALLAAGAATLGFVVAMLRYLQGSRARLEWSNKARFEHLELTVQQALRNSQAVEHHLTLEAKRQKDQGPVPPVSENQRRELANRLLEGIKEIAKADFLEEIRTSIKDQQAHLETHQAALDLRKELEGRHERTVERLVGELEDLSQRGNLNLAIGISIAAMGIGLLGYFVFVSMGSLDTDAKGFAVNFIPRISLVIFVQVFAYYFLRLYSSSLMEIKYFQNEITNVEVQFLAFRAAMETGNEKSAGEILLRLAQTERNYVLNKGQSTVDVERRKVEKETFDSLIQAIVKGK